MSSGITIMASVYDGRQRVGYVLHHLDERGFEAIDVEKRSYGTYATHQEAAAALPPVSSTEEITTAIKGGSRHG
jgi:topoisomerase IA-like protein